jgi:Tol biopolymer transport system component
VLLAILSIAPGRLQADPGTFLVSQRGLLILGTSGEEVERVTLSNIGSISPDGRWLAGVRTVAQGGRIELFIRSWDGAGHHTTVPLVWEKHGSGIQLVWSADSKRLVIGENWRQENGAMEYAFRVYDRASQKTADVNVPVGHWVTGWSPDGSRLLTTARVADRTIRIACVNFDGTGRPEFVTPENEFAFGAVLSPDGRKILC